MSNNNNSGKYFKFKNLHRAGTFNDAHIVYVMLDGDRPLKICCSNMDTSAPVFYAAGLPALISTGITCIYLILKVISYLFHAISHKTEGRVATATPGCPQYQHSPDSGEEGDLKICTQVSGHVSEQYGAGTQ